MGKKFGKFKKKETSGSAKNKPINIDSDDDDMMNDEIDVFHKNRDVVPLDVDDDTEQSDEDNEHPVLEFEDDKDEDEDDEDDEDEDDYKPAKGLEAKIVRTQKYLRAKFGEDDDEMLEDAEEEERPVVWGRKKDLYYERQVDDDDAEAEEEEEEEALKLQSEKAKTLTMKDFGLEDASEDEADREPTFEEILDHGKPTSRASLDKAMKNEDGMTCEIVKKDLNALTKEEQMDVVYSSAPELVGLLSELSSALEELENKINPLVNKVQGRESSKKGGLHYIEVKQLLLQSYCQAITFYLLLKTEGQTVRDHPVVSRLVEIKGLLDKTKEMDENLPFDMADFVNKDVIDDMADVKLAEETNVLESGALTNSKTMATISSEKQPAIQPNGTGELNTLKTSKNSESERKHQDKQVGAQSKEMLKVRAALEEKLKQKGVFSSIARKNVGVREHLQPVNRQLETLDDFDDEAMQIDGVANGDVASLSHSSKISQHLSLHPNKRKVISGDDDMPKRDDIGERRRKHELRVLAGAGIGSFDDVATAKLSSDSGSDVDEENESDSDLEYYKQAEQQHAEKIAAKSDKYSRTAEVSSLPDDVVDGKRHITRQIEKNRGLTRSRKKLIKNPRKKYKLKHKKAEVRRKGQVREIRKPAGPYGGEASGINAGISRSIRFKG